MATARPVVSVYNSEKPSEKKGTIPMPVALTSPLRPDLVRFVHTGVSKNRRQAIAVTAKAGYDTAAESWGTGRAVARIPRAPGGGTHRAGQATFGNMCRGGGMFNPTKTWRRWHRRVNVTQKRHAIASALAASTLPPLVMARGHRIGEVPELPLVVSEGAESLAKTKDAVQLLKDMGCAEELQRVIDSKKVRKGKGKMRNRRYVGRKGPLVVYNDADAVLPKAVRNLPGVDLCHVDRLNLLLLAPGGHAGRFILWTSSAFAKLDGLYGSAPGEAAEQKKGFTMPRPCMLNADLARLINSDEIQSVVRPAQADVQRPKGPKKNPLKNLEAMLKLNPYHAVHAASEQRDRKSVV